MKQIGKGGFGKVYLAQASEYALKYDGICNIRNINNYVVIKKMDTLQLSKNKKELATNEATILKALHHPNIIQFYQSFVRVFLFFVHFS